ncbi:hypothetical protein SEUCBS139899_006742 [Sporothrix eucalyptigena]|uniref:Cyanovirin-N domain-containing protein n=1 Tax=Sporothrix eucalyptigena TaxID=1812306 RepID=A0ABP0CK96_9PEZI
MKNIVSFACLVGASTVAGLQALSSPSELTWTGEVTPGAGPVTFAGDAKSIYRQILEANPSFKSDLRRSTSSVDARDLLKRENPSPVSSNYNCGYGVLVDVTPIDAGIKDLYNIGSGTCNAPAGAPGAGGCTRLTCTDDASIWLCNDNDFAVEIPCTLIADNAVQLLIECQTTTYAGGNTWDSTVRGQIFASDGTWNVIINENTC